MSKLSLRTMVEIGVMVAVAMVLNFVKLYEMPQGGSVSLEMLPIFIIALRWGPTAGITAGVLHGVAQLLFGGKIYFPVQALLDYPVAFGILGIAAFLPRLPLLGISLGTLGRFLTHVYSGVIFFGEYTPEGMNPWVYSLGYNATYLVPELILNGIVIYFLVKRSGIFDQLIKQPLRD